MYQKISIFALSAILALSSITPSAALAVQPENFINPSIELPVQANTAAIEHNPNISSTLNTGVNPTVNQPIPNNINIADHNPLGNNGTVKVDGIDFDTHPDNQPHVGCQFQIDFYGYDKGALFAAVTFEAQPPTEKLPKTGSQVLLTDTVFIGEDDATGAGSEAGLDAQKTYNILPLLTGITPHDQQGYHIKLTINADGSQGNDIKHKVFWVEGCQPNVGGGNPPGGGLGAGGNTGVGGGASPIVTQVSGSQSDIVTPGVGELPQTGSFLETVISFLVALMVGGYTFMRQKFSNV
jgi:hypothetical protein